MTLVSPRTAAQGSAAADTAEPTSTASASGFGHALDIAPRAHSALGDGDEPRRNARDQLLGATGVDHQCLEVAVVDPDARHGAVRRGGVDRALKFFGVAHLEQHLETQLAGDANEFREPILCAALER